MIRPPFLSDEAIREFIDAALLEDIGEGDHSTLGSIPANLSGAARLLVKDNGIIAGIELAGKIFHQYDPELRVKFFNKEGDEIKKGDIVFVVEGSVRSILSTERLVLNCLQRMSGIATYTKRLTELIKGTKAVIMDTRKTTPNFRLAEKWAVAIGGAKNHRFALYDMVMLKDNHIDAAGGIEQALTGVGHYLRSINKDLKIEIEARNLEDVKEALRVGGIDVIMLDNMTISDMKKAVEWVGSRVRTEASGGITEANLLEVAATGVDYISIGALTHSARSLDLSLKIVPHR